MYKELQFAVFSGMEGRQFGVGDRVEIHPRFDLWMRGARFGTVRSVHETGNGRILIKVKLDKVRKLFRVWTDEGSRVTCLDLKRVY